MLNIDAINNKFTFFLAIKWRLKNLILNFKKHIIGNVYAFIFIGIFIIINLFIGAIAFHYIFLDDSVNHINMRNVSFWTDSMTFSRNNYMNIILFFIALSFSMAGFTFLESLFSQKIQIGDAFLGIKTHILVCSRLFILSGVFGLLVILGDLIKNSIIYFIAIIFMVILFFIALLFLFAIIEGRIYTIKERYNKTRYRFTFDDVNNAAISNNIKYDDPEKSSDYLKRIYKIGLMKNYINSHYNIPKTVNRIIYICFVLLEILIFNINIPTFIILILLFGIIKLSIYNGVMQIKIEMQIEEDMKDLSGEWQLFAEKAMNLLTQNNIKENQRISIFS